MRTTLAAPEWTSVAEQRNRSMIHATGVLGPEAYEASGAQDAQRVAAIAAPGSYPVVLDFGAGDGRVAVELAKLYRHVVAVDGSRAMLRLLAERIPEADRGRIDLVRDDGARIERRVPGERVVDVVVSFGLFKHLPYDHGVQVLSGLSRTVRPGGLLVLEIPLGEAPRMVRTWSDEGRWTTGQLVDALDPMGLRIVAIDPESPLVVLERVAS